ncbi:Rhs family protein [Oleiphilus messinensis]|uniref:Rhs family protein n=1 Tax=Oleiphilus messinensis TaxID=141451 RepID=A0A1Y0I847_9GAMM|nr:RHS repeat-associated core domain-containing protein [Oleiphilus messinensis]ARU55665.1 Rhs family protein [Oleiphilus messinensis]
MVISPGRTIQWSPFGKPVRIDRGSGNSVVEFEYGPDRSRTRRIDQKVGGTETTTTYVGSYEKEVRADKTIERYSIAGIAIVTRETSTESGNTVTTTKEQYLLRDTLGSVVGILDRTTLDYNSLLASSSTYDAWGQRRHLDGTPFTTAELFADANGDITNRGFTGHEQVDGVGLIHMNGRMYDPVIGRFISADPVMQDPTDYQNLNRYSYVRNNPLTLIDPSGFSWWSKKGRGIFGKVFAAFFPTVAISTPQGLKEFGRFARKNKYIAETVQVVGCTAAASTGAAAPAVCGAIVSATTYGVTDGDLGAAARAGAVAFIQGYLMHGISSNLGFAGGAVAAGVIGGGASAAMGGSFKSGFVAGAASFAVSPFFASINGYIGQIIVSAVVGGTISQISGGSFANGAITGAFAYVVKSGAQALASSIRTSSYSASEANTPWTEQEVAALAELIKKEHALAADLAVKMDWEALKGAFGFDVNPKKIAFGWSKIADRLSAMSAGDIHKMTADINIGGTAFAAELNGNLYVSKTFMNRLLSGRSVGHTLIHETAHLLGWSHSNQDFNPAIPPLKYARDQASSSKVSRRHSTYRNPYNYDLYINLMGR